MARWSGITLARHVASSIGAAAGWANVGCVVAWLIVPVAIAAQMEVLTNRYDSQRTGANLTETRLRPATVSSSAFGKLYSYPVDGSVYAQPLYVRGLTVNGAPHNVLYVATMNDKVYAFDADSPASTPLWLRDFTSPPSVTPVPITDLVAPNLNIVGNIGVQGTPVIDRTTNTLYLVARTKESGVYVQRLHAMDLATGTERSGSPVRITGSVPGTSPDSTVTASGRTIAFDPRIHVQRAGLALVNGVVLVSWAAHEDTTPSHGWIMGFDASTLARVGIFAVTTDAYGGGVWQGGRAPAIDAAGHVYIATGNGLWDGTRNFGNSLLELGVSRTTGFTLLDYFTPGNEAQLSTLDYDLSGSGFTLLPGTNLLLGGGKEGVLYLLNAANLGHKFSNDTQIPQRIAVSGGHVMGGAVFWSSSTLGPLVYNWSEDDVLKAYRLSAGRLATPPYAQGQVMSPGHPGGSLALSANGSTSGTGIVWASMPTNADDLHGLTAGILRAFNAETLQEIWTSEQNAARDRVGTLMKFVPPTVANGKVYIPNHDGAVRVYGPLDPDFSLTVTPASRTVVPGASTTFSVSTVIQGGFSGAVTLTASGQPAGTTVSFNPQSISGAGTATMTVAVPANASAGTFSVVVSGTSGARVRSAAPATVTIGSGSAAVGAIGINFVGTATAMGTAETAGVVSQSHWNNAAGAAHSTPLPLVDAAGSATGGSVTWSGASVWATPISDVAGNSRLMKGYLDTTSTSATTVTVSGLQARAYDVYVYGDGDNHSYTRSAAYTISGAGITSSTTIMTDVASANFASTFTRASNSAGNYVKFTIAASGFTITATPTAPDTGTRRAPVNGIQIVPATAVARPLGINFVGSSTTPMGSAETAGVVVASHWNNASGASRTTPLPLIDDTGAGTGATVTWMASSVWATPITDQAGSRRLMKGYLDTTSTSSTTVTVAGLPARPYDVYVYADGDNHAYARSGAYTISGAGVSTVTIGLTDPANLNFGGTFIRASSSAGNYVKFSITAGGFTVTARPTTADGTTLRAPINGIQVVPAGQ
ncbi:MAG: hypothetical protein V7647_1825 [Acidobacteriota bacterium]